MKEILFSRQKVKLELENDNILIFTAREQPSLIEWSRAFIIGVNYCKKNYRTKKITWINDLTYLKSITAKHQCFLQKYVNPILQNIRPPINVYFIKPKNIYGQIAMQVYLKSSQCWSEELANYKVFNSWAELENFQKKEDFAILQNPLIL